MLKDPEVCQTLKDIKGPYQTEKQCEVRAYEIAMELPEWMPEYIATRYKCIENQEKLDIIILHIRQEDEKIYNEIIELINEKI